MCAQSNQQNASFDQSNKARLITQDNAPRLKTISLLKGHDDKATCVAWSPDGQCLATASKDKSVWVWAADKLDAHASLSGQPQSSRSNLLHGRIPPVSIIMPLQPVEKIETSPSLFPLVAWGPDGHALAFNDYKDVWMKRWSDGAESIASNGQGLTRLEGHTDYVTSLTWSPDGALLASGSEDSAVRVWDAQTQLCVSVLRGHSKSVLAIAFSPDGSLLASAGSDRNVRLWDLAAEAPAASLVDPEEYDQTTGLAWSPDGRLLAAARWPENVVRVWDVAGRKLLSSLPCTLPDVEPVGLGFIPDGQLLAAP